MLPAHALLHLPPHARAEPLARDWLAAHWGVDATTLPLARDARGRPQLQAPMQHRDANWSHSGEHLLVACGEHQQIGCDLERIRPRPNARALARRFFHPAERSWLETLPDPAAEATFLRLWCAKEALLKAHGHGLSFGLHRLCFVEDANGLRLAECDAALGRAADWHLHEFRPVGGYLGALAWRDLPAGSAGAAII